MAKHEIAVIRGDGIGVDVVNEALKVLDMVADKHSLDLAFINPDAIPSDYCNLILRHVRSPFVSVNAICSGQSLI